MLPLILVGAGAAGEEAPPARAAPEPGLPSGNGALGMPVDPTKQLDPNAQLPANKLGGRAQAEFLQLKDYAFDAVGDEYVASAKPGNFRIGKAFRDQAKRMREDLRPREERRTSSSTANLPGM